MAIYPICSKCGKEIDEFGGLLFSPPDKFNNARKHHLCKECYESIVKTLRF